jgi:hypothetical protein
MHQLCCLMFCIDVEENKAPYNSSIVCTNMIIMIISKMFWNSLKFFARLYVLLLFYLYVLTFILTTYPRYYLYSLQISECKVEAPRCVVSLVQTIRLPESSVSSIIVKVCKRLLCTLLHVCSVKKICIPNKSKGSTRRMGSATHC